MAVTTVPVPANIQAAPSRLPGLDRLTGGQKVGILVALAAIVALLVGGFLWGQSIDYRVLYTNLSDRDGGAVIASLQQMNVPYKFAEGGGALLVPAGNVHEVRLRLASQGLPKGSTVGFELMENQKFGVSQFNEQVNYQRALEGELARSIQSLSAVQSARVHLAMAKQSVFVRDQQKPTASVIVNLYPGKGLEESQVNAIVHLVSSSVPELPVKGVSVIDQNGRLLSASDDRDNGLLNPTQLKYVREVEHDYQDRIERILTPIVGPDNVRAQVAADIDFTSNELVDETYKPNSKPADQAIRSQQSNDANSTGGAGVGGVPGALSNQPPANATAPVTNGNAQPNGQQAAAGPTSTQKNSTTNFELSKQVVHQTKAVGGIKRISVAVVVNNRKEVAADGKVTWKPLTQAEQTQINNLVKQAMGFDQKRGDTLNVVNTAFQGPERDTTPEPPMWKRPEMIALAKEIGKYLLIAGVVLYLVLGVLRPLLFKLAEPAESEDGGKMKALTGNSDDEDADDAGEGADGEDGDGAMVKVDAYSARLAQAKDIAKQDPKLVANIVRNWVTNE